MEQRDFLRKQMLKKTREQINEKFAGKEIHIIKAVNLLGDLDSINNLLTENASEWKARKPTGEAQTAYASLEESARQITTEREALTKFIESEMAAEFPTFSVLATPIIGAKLLASAGSKKKLCFAPSSTIQVLGAEKALFAHIKTHAKGPKHGHLFNHPLLQTLPRIKRGKVARILAGKLSIALKQDYFKGKGNSSEMLAEVETIVAKIAAEPITPKEAERDKQYEDEKKANEMRTDFLKRQAPHDRHLFEPQRDILEKNKNFGERSFAKKPYGERAPRYGRREREDARGETGSRNDRPAFAPARRFSRDDSFPARRFDRPRFGGERSERSFGPKRFGPRREERSFSGDGERPFRPRTERPFRPRGDRGSFGRDRPFESRPRYSSESRGEQSSEGFSSERPSFHKPRFGKGRFGKPKFGPKRFGNKSRGNKGFEKRY